MEGESPIKHNTVMETAEENMPVFQDESTDCAICLGSLSDPDMEVIELTTCGHRWHLDCLKEQLENAQPNPAQRLVLTGCRCAKCGGVCDHPALRHLTRKTDALREKVDAVLKEQLDDGKRKDEEALEEARRKFAIYLCSHCNEPYFGGTIDCADTVEGEVPPEERLCVACAPTRLQQAHCRHPLEHRGHHVWKCRYCCNVATHVCYGVVHFCNDCHDRNSERVAQIQQQQWRRRQRQNNQSQEPPACLQPILCLGGDACPFPKPQGETHHKNGKSADCEQIYACGWCQSNPAAANHAFVEAPGSRNLILNSSGEDGLRGWQQAANHGGQWRVEDSEIPLGNGITTNFVSTYQWCVMSQVVPLHHFVRDASRVRIEASAKYMSRTDCASVFRMELFLLDRNHRPLARRRSEQFTAPADFWERASLTIHPTPNAHEAAVVVYGKDVPFWAGYFGSKVCDIKLRVLGSPEELDRVMIPGEERVGVGGDWLRGLFGRGEGGRGFQGQAQQQDFLPYFFSVALPVVFLLILSQLLL